VQRLIGHADEEQRYGKQRIEHGRKRAIERCAAGSVRREHAYQDRCTRQLKGAGKGCVKEQAQGLRQPRLRADQQKRSQGHQE